MEFSDRQGDRLPGDGVAREFPVDEKKIALGNDTGGARVAHGVADLGLVSNQAQGIADGFQGGFLPT